MITLCLIKTKRNVFSFNNLSFLAFFIQPESFGRLLGQNISIKK